LPPNRAGLRVAMLATLPGGGSVEQALLLTEQLLDRSIEVRVITTYPRVADRFRSLGAAAVVIPFRHWLDPLQVVRLGRAMSGADIVHAHDRRSALWMRLLPRPGRSTLRIHTAHGIADAYLPLAARPHPPRVRDAIAYHGLDPALARRSDAIIVPSHAVANDLISRFRYPAERVTVIPNGVDVRVPPHFGSQQGYVSTLSALEKYKGLDVFVRAAAQIVTKRPNIEFALFGTGSQAEALASQCHTLGVTAQVHLRGFVKATEALRSTRIFVMSSRWENAPIAMLEAMAAGVPVVTTNVYGIPEIATPETAQLVPPDDPYALSEAIGRLLDDARLAARQAQAARARVEANFSASANADRVLAVYEHARSRRARSQAPA
jgi:glycosyltransferase involved in cell wall biosynthesis